MGTGMPAVLQRFGHAPATTAAHLACPSRVHDHHNQPSLFRFGGENGQELVPASIRNTLCQTMVAHHVLDAQALNSNGPMGIHDLACGLVRKVPMLIEDTTMGFSHQEFGQSHVLDDTLLRMELAMPLGQDCLGLYDDARLDDM